MEGPIVLIPIIATAGFYAMVAFVVYVVVKGRQRRNEMQAEVQSRMIDKFSSAPEFLSFLQSDAGKSFISTFEEAPRSHARDRILGGVTRSTVLTLLGLGFLGLCVFESTRDSGFIITGFILLSLGIGYFIATIASIRLSKAWGLLPTEPVSTTDSRP